MYISSDGDESVVKITANGLVFSTDNGETWKPFGYHANAYFGKYGVDDAIDSVRYATEIVDSTGVIHNTFKQYAREDLIKKAFNNLEGEDCCRYCRYKDECHGMTSNGRGEPVYPACADMNVEDYLDYEVFKEEYLEYEKFKEDYLREFKEEKIMNILEIYKSRKAKAIDQEYEEKRESIENNNEIINRYNEITNTFRANMDEFANEEKVKASGLIQQTPYFDNYRYELNRFKVNELFEDIDEDRKVKIAKLDELINEVKAMMDIVPHGESYDAKIIEILKNYEILDKKGKINA